MAGVPLCVPLWVTEDGGGQFQIKNDVATPLKDEATLDGDNELLVAADAGEGKSGTPLFSAIKSEKWENAILFLETGSFSGGGESTWPLCGCGENEASQDPESQVRTWVVNTDWWGNVVSKRLPIHAAVTKKAPSKLIQKLIKMYPESIRSKDLDGNLPLHLSFQHNTPDGVVAFLLKSYPDAVSEKNDDGKQPVDYASEDACEIIQLCVEQTNKVAKREEARLCQALESEKMRLTEILTQLSDIRGELDHMRKANVRGQEPSTLFSATEKLEQVEEKLGATQITLQAKQPRKQLPKTENSNRMLRFPWKKKKVGAA